MSNPLTRVATRSVGVIVGAPARATELGMERVLQGRYKIEEPLGVGGSSQVYLARDQALNRDVALKVLDPAAAADGNLRRMFVKEAREQRYVLVNRAADELWGVSREEVIGNALDFLLEGAIVELVIVRGGPGPIRRLAHHIPRRGARGVLREDQVVPVTHLEPIRTLMSVIPARGVEWLFCHAPMLQVSAGQQAPRISAHERPAIPGHGRVPDGEARAERTDFRQSVACPTTSCSASCARSSSTTSCGAPTRGRLLCETIERQVVLAAAIADALFGLTRPPGPLPERLRSRGE